MIAEDYVSYEIAKLLKEKGFPMGEHLFMYVNKDNVFMTNDYACLKLPQEEYKNFYEVYIPTITYQMAMKWLREVHHIHIGINPISGKGYNATIYDVTDFDDYRIISDTESFFHVRESVEVALKYCLTELI